MRDGCEMVVGLRSPVFGCIARASDGAANEHLADAGIFAALDCGDGIGADRNLNSVDVEWRGGKARFPILSPPEVKLISGTLKRFDYVNAPLSVIAH